MAMRAGTLEGGIKVRPYGQVIGIPGIIDIFSYTDETPVRIELWDDEIDSIRFFDVESQRSVEKIQTYDVFPATEWIYLRMK